MERAMQTVCVQIVRQMNTERKYSESEKEVLAYGLELISDSMLKIFVYLAMGAAFGKGKEMLAAVLAFGILRMTSGEDMRRRVSDVLP